MNIGAQQQVRVGEILARKYRVDGVLGAGGMGTVVRAFHLRLGQAVAIKILHRELMTSADAARRFALEARATASLKSASSVRILDIDQLDTGVPFIVMELLDGKDLGSIVEQSGPLAVDQAVRYILQATGAIAEAHGLGIVHRDIKPENIFLTREGVVKVVDFGLAKALPTDRLTLEEQADSDRTGTHVLLGSPSYMSPEQILSSRDVDLRTDIWGLGVTLFNLLTGTPPFAAPNFAILASVIMTRPAPRLSEARKGIPPALDALVARCMQKQPEARYPNTAALRAALVHVLAELTPRSVNPQTAGLGATVRAIDDDPESDEEKTKIRDAPDSVRGPPDSEPPTAVVGGSSQTIAVLHDQSDAEDETSTELDVLTAAVKQRLSRPDIEEEEEMSVDVDVDEIDTDPLPPQADVSLAPIEDEDEEKTEIDLFDNTARPPRQR